jgi:hypothetical protein
MTKPLRAAFLLGTPVAFSGLLWLHPMVGDWEGLREATTRFQAVHVGMVLTFCLLAVGMHVLLEGLHGRAASVARVALIPFAAFYIPYLAFEGFAIGALGQELNALPAAERDAVAPRLIEELARNPIMGEPGVFWIVGSTAWIVVVVASVMAFRRAGAPTRLQVLLGASALIAGHTPPLGPIGLVCFAAASWMVLRRAGAQSDPTRWSSRGGSGSGSGGAVSLRPAA